MEQLHRNDSALGLVWIHVSTSFNILGLKCEVNTWTSKQTLGKNACYHDKRKRNVKELKYSIKTPLVAALESSSANSTTPPITYTYEPYHLSVSNTSKLNSEICLQTRTLGGAASIALHLTTPKIARCAITCPSTTTLDSRV